MFFTLRFRLISMNKLLPHVQFNTHLFKKYNLPYLSEKYYTKINLLSLFSSNL